MLTLNVPRSAVKFIAFQRTEILRFRKIPGYSLLRRLTPFSLYELGVSLESRLGGNKIRAFYAADMAQEYADIKTHLPDDCRSILDIGCGVAGIDALLYHHYAKSPPTINLLDKSSTEDAVFYGFKQRGAFYNSLEIAEQLLSDNGVPTEDIQTFEANAANDIPMEGPVDLIISLISWGFHYPVDTYLDPVHSIMDDDSRLILDVRRDTGGEAALEKKFRNLELISQNSKSQRWLAMK